MRNLSGSFTSWRMFFGNFILALQLPDRCANLQQLRNFLFQRCVLVDLNLFHKNKTKISVLNSGKRET